MSAIKHYCKKYLIRPEIWIRNTVMLGFLTRDRFLMFHEDFFLHRREKRKNKRKFWSTNIVLNLKFVQELHMKEHSWIRHISFSIVRRIFFFRQSLLRSLHLFYCKRIFFPPCFRLAVISELLTSFQRKLWCKKDSKISINSLFELVKALDFILKSSIQIRV